MTKSGKNSRKNNGRKSQQCERKAEDSEVLAYSVQSVGKVSVEAEDELKTSRLLVEDDVFTLCDFSFEEGKLQLPADLWNDDHSDSISTESVASEVLHLLYGVSSLKSGSSSGSGEDSDDDELIALFKTPWISEGRRHSVLLPPKSDEGYIVADLSNAGDHDDHGPAMELSEDIPLKKCRLPRFAVHQTITTLTLVFFVQNVDKTSVSTTLCTCNSLLRIAFCMNSEHHTTYRLVFGSRHLQNALHFPQAIKCDVIKDTMLVVYLEKAPQHHGLWSEISAGAAGTSELKTFSLLDNTIDTKLCDSFSPYSLSSASLEPQRACSVPCYGACSLDGDHTACRGILKNGRLCARTLSECSDNLEYSSWDLSESLKGLVNFSSSVEVGGKKTVHFNNKVVEMVYKPTATCISKRKNRLQRTRSLSESSELSSEENCDSICDDLNRLNVNDHMFHLELEESAAAK